MGLLKHDEIKKLRNFPGSLHVSGQPSLQDYPFPHKEYVASSDILIIRAVINILHKLSGELDRDHTQRYKPIIPYTIRKVG
jgi:hypothetical protein